ncbi:PREDICTED: uncharacterized protein LOC109205394 [Nicotiana attenuata]|uniref:uncharacterized protein LOC109205394 n=1 Tax=Nicotiana attenuata TaxID=49451 RepID=UPI000904E688|nr:PREDICTED: uncharacterized protein LOC109205394 [Nicotiana attenuata]
MEGEKVLLKVSHMKVMMRFGKNGKLSSRLIGLFEVLERVGEVDYMIALPPSVARVHSIFHICVLQVYDENKSHILDINIVQLDKNLSYEEEPVAIADRQFWKLRSK